MIRVYGSTIIGKGMTSFDEDATTFINAAGITEQQQKDAVNFLVQSLKKKHLWDSFEALYPVVGANAIAHSFNLINPSKHRITWGGNEATIQHTLFGMTLKTGVGNLNLTTNDVGLDSICSSFYVGNTVAAITYDITNQSVQNDRYYVHLQYNDNRYMFTCGNAYGDANLECNVNEAGTAGLMTASHEGNWMGLYKNGALLTSKTMTASMAPSGRQLIMNSTSFNNDRQFRLVAFHKNFSESQMVVLSNIIQEYQSMLNRAVGEKSDFDADSLTFIEAAELAQPKQQTILNDLVKDLKKTKIWGKLTAIYPFIGGNANAHSYNLKNPEKYRFTWGDLAEHSSLGIVPHTQAHHNNLPVADISSNAGNDVSINMYVDDNNNKSETVDVYSTVISNSINLTVYLYSIGKYIRFDCGSGTSNSLTLSDVDASGFMSLTSIQNKLTAYRNGVCIGEKVNNPGNIQSITARFNYDNASRDNCKQYRFLSWGKGLTSDEVFLLNGIIQKYQAKLDRVMETDEASDADASAFIEAAQIKDPNQQLAVNYLTHSLKSAGLWDKFTTLYPLVGGTYDSCKYNLIDIAQNILSNAEGVVYSKKGIMPTNNVEIGSFNNLFPNYNTNLESSFDMYIQEDIESTTHDLGFEDTKNGFCIFSNYTGREVYYLSAYTGGNNVTEEKRISKIVNVPTNGLFSGQSKTGNLSVYKDGKVLISETKTPQNIPDYPVFMMKNIRTLSLVATRKSNLTDTEFITYNNIIRTYQCILNREVKYDPLLTDFINVSGIENISLKEQDATNNFLISLRSKSSLFQKILWIHPYIGETVLSRSLNLLDVNKYKITFNGNVSHNEKYTVYNTGAGVINLMAGKPVNTDMSMTFYVRNNITGSIYDISSMPQSPSLIQGFYLKYPTYGTIFDCGNYNTGRLVNTSITPVGVLTANIYGSEMSIWQDATKKASKTSGFTLGAVENYTYNASNTNNIRQYGIACVTNGLSAQETIDLHTIINAYMTALGRAI